MGPVVVAVRSGGGKPAMSTYGAKGNHAGGFATFFFFASAAGARAYMAATAASAAMNPVRRIRLPRRRT